jgi:hypothetical protein
MVFWTGDTKIQLYELHNGNVSIILYVYIFVLYVIFAC